MNTPDLCGVLHLAATASTTIPQHWQGDGNQSNKNDQYHQHINKCKGTINRLRHGISSLFHAMCRLQVRSSQSKHRQRVCCDDTSVSDMNQIEFLLNGRHV